MCLSTSKTAPTQSRPNWRFQRAELRAWRSARAVGSAAGAVDHEGKLNYSYNWVGLQEYKMVAVKPLLTGDVTVKFDFVYDGGGFGKGGIGTSYVNEEKVAETRTSTRS